VHAKERVRGLMREFNQTAKFVGRQNHAATLTKYFWQGTTKKRRAPKIFAREKPFGEKERGRTLLRPLQQHLNFLLESLLPTSKA
jgi:hypothetical protein